MFPHARNSLRRWSPGEQQHQSSNSSSSGSGGRSNNRSTGSQKVPIPIAVSLHNVMMAPPPPPPPPQTSTSSVASPTSGRSTNDSAGTTGSGSDTEEGNDSTNSNTHHTTRFRRPRHEVQILPLLQLEVLVDDSNDDDDDDENDNEHPKEEEDMEDNGGSRRRRRRRRPPQREDEYSSQGDAGDKGDDLSSADEIHSRRDDSSCHRSVYTCPELVRSVQPEWEHLDERINLPGEWWRSSSSNSPKGGTYKTMRLRILQVHPNSTNTAMTTTNQKQPPDLIHEDESKDMDDNSNSNSNNKNNGRQVFLEIPLHPSKLERLYNTSSSRNGENKDDDSNDLVLPSSLPPNACLVYYSDGSTRCSPSLFSLLLKHQLTQPAPIEDFSRFEDDVFRTLDGAPQTPERIINSNRNGTGGNRARAESLSALLEPQELLDSQLIDAFDNDNEQDEEDDAADVLFEETEVTTRQSDVQKERKRLLALIAREENQLEEEVTCLQEEREELASMLQAAKQVEDDIRRIQAETRKQTAELRKDELQRQARHRMLLKDLQTVYPITLDPKKGYLIRQWRLPVDIYTTTVPEEELSAALGYCSHLVLMISKYLSIALRYRLFCNSSRSAIQLDSHTFLPLFTSRSVEREHLDRAMGLLGANVDCILLSLGIDYTPNSHILARLKRVYDQIIDGEIPLR